MREHELLFEKDLTKILILPSERKRKYTTIDNIRSQVEIDVLLRNHEIVPNIVLPAEVKHSKKST
jgi:hypothetical protein